ncbi:uncharacterized protein LOC104585560 [Brachypodium distachyon]|uniref:uncharacterized protein LOC104585560 n=1 Tax=Brachypodium distachyon TaxID=15368 RepID=UPI000D0C9C77|nr:uncharacterized protein LOC104585560 [Brachypodium distachyon]|eukprot:XP_014751139.2 uncharacterized protein LOC104585560 [Brachypodium distachyon]
MQPPQTPQKLPPRAPSPQGFVGGAAFSPMQGIGASEASAAAAAVRARAAEQMAYEDAWKASNPDFKTPFASVEDAVSRLLPYHVFADYEEDDDVCEGDTEKSSDEKWDQQVIEAMSSQISEFEKQVLAFNVMAGKRADGTMCSEEKLLLDLMLQNDERRMTEHLRAALIAQHEKQQEEEAARAAAARLALVQAQAGGSGPWTLVQQPTASAWQQALAAAALGPGVAQMPPQQQLDNCGGCAKIHHRVAGARQNLDSAAKALE